MCLCVCVDRSKAGVWQIQVDQVPKVGSESPTAGAISPLSTDAGLCFVFSGRGVGQGVGCLIPKQVCGRSR